MVDGIQTIQLRHNIQSLRNQGVKTNDSLNIAQALANTSIAAGTEQDKGIVSKEEYTYKNMKGTLIKLSDGSATFVTKQDVNGENVTYQYKFETENDIKKQTPSQEIINPGNSKKQLTKNYEYYDNNKVKTCKTLNASNILIKEENYNKKGKIDNGKTYDKTGKLISSSTFKYNDDNSVDTQTFDANNELQETGHIQYKDDGKTRVSFQSHYTNGTLKKDVKYDDNGKKSTETVYWDNGTTKSEGEYWDNGVIKRQKSYDNTGKQTSEISPDVDGNFGLSSQVGQGDCYLMSTINSIRQLDNGQEMLKNLVKVETNANGEKTYVVTFPGAKMAAEGLKTDSKVDSNKVHITGEYRFTESEFQKILKQAGKKYSIGDGDVILLEAAFEKYRQEVKQTMEDNPNLKKQTGVAGTLTGSDSDNILNNGRPEDATYILTGKKSKAYENNVQYGLDSEKLQETGEFVIVSKPTQGQTLGVKAAAPEVDGGYSSSQNKLNELLDSIMTDGNDGHIDNIATASFSTVKDDGTVGGHAFTIKSVTKDSVTLINPWHPEKEVTMSRDEFVKCCKLVTVADTSTETNQTNNNQTNNNQTNNNQTNNNQTNNNTTNNTTQNSHNSTTTHNGDSNTGTQSNIHKVKRGDNLWKIAKSHLGGNPSSTQIANYVLKIMKANPSLKWSNSHTVVVIHPGDKIVLP